MFLTSLRLMGKLCPVSRNPSHVSHVPKAHKKKGKGSFYIAQYSVRWTAQSASHFPKAHG